MCFGSNFEQIVMFSLFSPSAILTSLQVTKPAYPSAGRVEVNVKFANLSSGQICFDRTEYCASTGISLGDELCRYSENGQLEKALHILSCMDHQGIVPSVSGYGCLLKLCAKRKSLAQTKLVHAHLAKNGLELTRFLGEFVVSTLVKCGALEDALQLFHRLQRRTVFSWTAVISGYVGAGLCTDALLAYYCMQEQGVQPNSYTLVSLLKACGNITHLEEGKRIHDAAVEYGFMSDLVVSTSVVDMYARCGSVLDAQNVFNSLSDRDVISWNVMLSASSSGDLVEEAWSMYEQMLEEGISANGRTYVSMMQVCGIFADKEDGVVMDGRLTKAMSLQRGRSIHADAWRKGLESDVFVCNTLVSMYGKCGLIADAHDLLRRLPVRTLVSWNAMLSAYVHQGQPEEALQLYMQLLEEGVSPDDRTFVSSLQACGMVAEMEEGVLVHGEWIKGNALGKGKAIHATAWRKGFQDDLYLGSVLASLYGKCGSIQESSMVLQGLSHRDVASWNAMLTACNQQGQAQKTWELYGQLLEEGQCPNSRTFVLVLQACGLLAETKGGVRDGALLKPEYLERVKLLHSQASMRRCDSDVFVASTLVSSYGKCGSIMDAWNVFDDLPCRNVVSWNAILEAYIQQGDGEKVIWLYEQMQVEGVSPDEISLLSVLQAVGNLGNLDVCRRVHHSVLSSEGSLSSVLGTSLVNAYGRCGSMADARGVFDALCKPDLVSWSTLISGYARVGNWEASIQAYDAMRLMRLKPDGVTFLSLLSVCSHAGLVGKGVQYFESMITEYGITPDIEHYVSMVDLLGRAGYFTHVQDLLATMPMQPSLSMWLCLLGACRKHGKVLLGQQFFKSALLIEPEDAAAYVLMASIYAQAGQWELVNNVHDLRKKAGAWKSPGQSWIRHQQGVTTFTVGDSKYINQEQLTCLLIRAGEGIADFVM